MYLHTCICLFVFTCLTPEAIDFGVLVPRAFQKYSTSLVFTEFLILGEISALEGGGVGGIPIVNSALDSSLHTLV